MMWCNISNEYEAKNVTRQYYCYNLFLENVHLKGNQFDKSLRY